jgi:hypothetical protein
MASAVACGSQRSRSSLPRPSGWTGLPADPVGSSRRRHRSTHMLAKAVSGQNSSSCHGQRSCCAADQRSAPQWRLSVPPYRHGLVLPDRADPRQRILHVCLHVEAQLRARRRSMRLAPQLPSSSPLQTRAPTCRSGCSRSSNACLLGSKPSREPVAATTRRTSGGL